MDSRINVLHAPFVCLAILGGDARTATAKKIQAYFSIIPFDGSKL